ncbi:pyridoxine/pyridoxamine 5'-phosphate oxidase [Agromyces albus]|uniref:pyridoxine/pyridoxamine 5'-phosphate oxidase n=1 Tax=Agromyces albus TaxID=205332 RepID=UPI002785C5AB|nr:pyridoxal 5'-phosphate synthase [Agromyces albus]MDQ0577463.1 pyridoxamine 5'-phosphate oxidase [Agromyces albus]
MSAPRHYPVTITSTQTFGEDQPNPDETLSEPLVLLGRWLPENTDELRPLMTLSTIDAEGYPDSRNVLLSEFDGEALYFHTDAGSRKAGELAANPRVSLTFVWVELGRQLTVVGDAEPASAEEAAAVFASRSRYLQLLAWSNTAELAERGVAARRKAWAAFAAEHPDGTLDAPPTWVGFRVTPRRITFWRGDLDGPSNRVEYTRAGDGWSAERLPG